MKNKKSIYLKSVLVKRLASFLSGKINLTEVFEKRGIEKNADNFEIIVKEFNSGYGLYAEEKKAA